MPSPKPPFLPASAQLRRLSPHFPLSRGVPRVDDRQVLSGIIYASALACIGAMPIADGSPKTLCNRFVRWRALKEDTAGVPVVPSSLARLNSD